MDKDVIAGVAKSKTVYGAVLGSLIIMVVRKFFHVELTADEAAIIMAAIMIVLRFFTDRSLKEKGAGEKTC